MTDAKPAEDYAEQRGQLLEMLAPILARVSELKPEARTEVGEANEMAATLEREFPYESAEVQALGRAIAAGVEQGWLCNRGPAQARFSRVAKPSPQTHELSIDVVEMEGRAIDHTHPQGEVTICFPSPQSSSDAVETGNHRFDGHSAGWVVLCAGSRHVPTVEGGRMQLMYFLPGGAVEWH